jgi:hypothetical protein
MPYTGTLIENLAALFAVIGLIKVVVYEILFPVLKMKPPSTKLLDKIFKNKLLPYFYLSLFVLLSWILLSEITIVQYMFAFVTTACFFAYFLVLYPKQAESIVKEVFKDPGHDWLVYGITGIISLWTLYYLFLM